VVKEELEVLLVVAHLGTALLFLANLIWLVAAGARVSGNLTERTDPPTGRFAIWAAGGLLLLLLVGSYTSDYGYIPGWPLQHGRFIPNLDVEREAVHFLHRSLALAVGIVIAALAIHLRRRATDLPLAARLSRIAAALFAAEILIGALNIWTELNAVVVMFHLATGTAIWGCVIGIIAVTSPALDRLVAREGRPSTSPILESGR
jgi:heme A synthase